MKLALISFLAYCCPTQVTSACQYHPTLWCSSPEIAEECDVLKTCKSWLPESIEASYPMVDFSIYYETMSPDSKEMIGNQVFLAYSYLPNIMNLTLVPYGNAKTCALNVLGKYGEALYLIVCTEASSINVTEEAFLRVLQIDIKQVLVCANGKQGNQLQHEMALQIDALEPPHAFVPWVTLNGGPKPVLCPA